MQKALFGMDAKSYLTQDQRQLIAEDLDRNRTRLPERMNAALGTMRFRDQPARSGDLGSLVMRSQPFDGRSVFWDTARGDKGPQEDIWPVAVRLMNDLKAASSPVVESGEYRRSFGFVVGDRVTVNPPLRGSDYTVIGVTNVVSYSSTLENPTWPQPFRKVWRRIWALSKIEGFDARFRFIRGGSDALTVLRPHEWRDQYGKPTGVGPRVIRYAIPLIEVGPLGSMGSDLGVKSRRHRPFRRRR